MMSCDFASYGFTEAQGRRIVAAGRDIEEAAKAYGVAPALLYAIAWVESRFNNAAYSDKGAIGMFQLMPATSAELSKQTGVANLPSVTRNAAHMAAYFLRKLVDRYMNEEQAAAAYYAGAGRVDASTTAVPSIAASYVAAVMDARRKFVGLRECLLSSNPGSSSSTGASPRPPKSSTPPTVATGGAMGGAWLVLLGIAWLMSKRGAAWL